MDSNPNDPTYVQPEPDVIPPPAQPTSAASGLSDNTAAALAYVTIIPAIVFLVLEPYNRNAFIRFNALQCICLAVTVFACQIVLSFIPVVGWILLIPLWICTVVAWILCVTRALKGEWFKLPVIGDFAMKQAKAN
jgi:uncharacterized membrane protein